jgi:phospholipid/cholesterol/gamma-HCH transport system ATP-binding protein
VPTTPARRQAPDDAPPARVVGLHKAFDGRPVLEGVDLEVQRGQISVVLGGSGCGKSTLVRILLGLESYDAGSVKLFGDEMSALGRDAQREAMMHVGMLFQGGALFDSMTVGENVAFALRHVRHLPDDAIRRICRDNLLLVGLKNVEGLYPSQLSGGMRKRVALARAIAHEPEMLFVDEPTAGLDPVMAATISELILQLRERIGVSVLCITHDMTSTYQIADRVALLYQGVVHAEGTPDEFRDHPDPVVRQFVEGRAHGPIDG